jgi:hypothetical protein
MRSRRRKRTYNGRLFRGKRAYSFAEIAEKLDTHIRTVQVWRKEGLPILDDNAKPFLVMGYSLRDFLKARIRGRKIPLRIGEFFCPRCRAPRRSRADQLTAEITDRRLGRTHKQVLLRGACIACGQPLLLFSSDRKTAIWRENGLIFSELLKVINGSGISSVNTDILKGRENEQSKR